MKQNKCPRNKYPQFIMGVLAKASMGRPKHALKVPLLFFLLSFGGGRIGERGFFFQISLVPNVLPLCSVQVPNVFPNMFSIAPHFSPICTLLSPIYVAGPKGRNSILQNRTFYCGEPAWFHFFE